MPLCDKQVKKNLLLNCDRKRARGLGQDVYIIQMDKQMTGFSGFTFSSTDDKLITNITLVADEELVRVQSPGFGAAYTEAFESTDYDKSISQGFRVVIFNDDTDTKRAIDALMSRNDLAFVFKTKGKGSGWEIAGANSGFEMTDLTSDTGDAELKGARVIQFTATGEETPYTFKHETTPGVDDTASFLAGLAIPIEEEV